MTQEYPAEQSKIQKIVIILSKLSDIDTIVSSYIYKMIYRTSKEAGSSWRFY